MTSAYIHIPFCEHICYYCDFNKVFIEGQPVDEYIQALLKEIKITLGKYPSSTIETLYIGGGTPTALSSTQLETLLAGLALLLPIDKNGEYTIEVNPGDLTNEKIQILKSYGINRLSMGVQSFDNELLKKIGRHHTAEDVYRTVGMIEKHGFDNVSIDLIYALPNQSYSNFKDTLEKALELDLPHYSLYSLILENKTMFNNWARQGNLVFPNQDLEGDMFQLAISQMESAGRKQYEVSNFALPHHESRHNLVYWNNQNYYGFGAGASGYLENMRYRNHGPIQHYLAPLRKNELPVIEIENLTKSNQMEEEMFLGLRKNKGISTLVFEQKFGLSIDKVYGEVIHKLFLRELLTQEGDHIKLTKRGLFLGNDVFEEFLLPKEDLKD